MNVRTSLFDPAEHEPLPPCTWDEVRVRAAIERVVETTRDAFEPGRFWPRSPLDDYGLPVQRDRSLWIGAAGVLWALDRLGAGQGESGLYESYLADPDIPGSM